MWSRVSAAHGSITAPESSRKLGGPSDAAAYTDALRRAVEARQYKGECGSKRYLLLPPVSVLEQGWVPGYATMSPEDRCVVLVRLYDPQALPVAAS